MQLTRRLKIAIVATVHWILGVGLNYYFDTSVPHLEGISMTIFPPLVGWSLWWIGLPPIDPKDLEKAREHMRRKAEAKPLSVRAGQLVGRALRSLA